MLIVRYPVIFHPLPLAVTRVISKKNHKELTPQKQNVIWDDKFCHHIVVKTQFKRVKIDMQITMSSIQKRACRNIR